MKKNDLIRDWRNPLTSSPDSPAGAVDLSDDDVSRVHGGSTLSVCLCLTTLMTSCCNSGTCP